MNRTALIRVIVTSFILAIAAMRLSACGNNGVAMGPGNFTPAPTFLASCQAYLDDGETEDGLYTIDPDGDGGLEPFEAECDMTTDGGGWTLVLNYLHQAATTPTPEPRTDDLPVIGSSTLGTDESGSANWGHAGNALLSLFTFTETRWYCITSEHSRVLHFKANDTSCNNYLKTGTAVDDCGDIDAAATDLAGHTAFLPASMDAFRSNQGDRAMTEYPFYEASAHHWGIDGDGHVRWECDDTQGDAGQDTLHRIWIR